METVPQGNDVARTSMAAEARAENGRRSKSGVVLSRGKIELRGITKSFITTDGQSQVVAVADLNLSVATNEFVTLVGRSGCGKTTILNMIAGLVRPSQGEILLNGEPVVRPGPDRGMVFQHSALFPWLTVKGNIQFGPHNQGIKKDQIETRTEELVRLVALEGFEDHYPHQLSGGMQQRVAIARALALNPEILLMDEPFGALDELTRTDMQRELLRIWEADKVTVLFVTHSISEAIYLSDRVVVLTPRPGRVRRTIPITLPRGERSRSTVEFAEHYEEIHGAIN